MAASLTSDEVKEVVERLHTTIQAKHPDFKRIFSEAWSVFRQRHIGQAATVGVV